MEMFLTGLCMSLIGVIVCGVLFAAATREDRERDSLVAQPETWNPIEAPQFFVQPSVAPRHPSTRVPIEVLLLQIERHVRLEQAAAESFHQFPTAQSLHMQTMSPLVH
jgi:hypothetical protein